jgi:hypothetical protein
LAANESESFTFDFFEAADLAEYSFSPNAKATPGRVKIGAVPEPAFIAAIGPGVVFADQSDARSSLMAKR